MNMSETEIIKEGMYQMLPRRKWRNGTRPGVSNEDIKVLKTENEAEKEEASKWIGGKAMLNEKERRKVFGKVLEVAIRTCCKNHVYQQEGRFYLQKEGMPIGLRISGVVAELRMCIWMEEVEAKMMKNKMEVYMNETYVDDNDLLMEALAMGTRWSTDEDRMVTSEEALEEDTNGGEEDDTRTMREVRRMVNSITTDIQMEETVASSQEGGRLPVLDFQVWKEVDMEPNGKEVTVIKFEFYEKEMVSRFVMLADGALPDRMKTTVLAQEALRRERNTSKNVDKESRVRIRNKFLMKLRLSGYTARQRMNIVLSGAQGVQVTVLTSLIR